MTPRPEVRHYVRNQSPRSGVPVELIVLHSTQGANLPGIKDLVGLGNYFDVAAVQASAHAANDAQGNDARYVPDSRKAWTCAYYNSASVNLEMIGFAEQREWPVAQVQNAADWIAYWSKEFGIPIQRGQVSGGKVTKPGVVFHSDLGQLGGGHHDPGPNFPLDQCLAMAKKSTVSPRQRKRWERSLDIQRAKLKAVLALRARLRQNKLEGTAHYRWSTRKMNALKSRIRKLTGLLRRK